MCLDRSPFFQIDEIMKDFRLTDATYSDIMELLEKEMVKGLSKNTHASSTVRMYPTYVRNIPDGSGEAVLHYREVLL